MTNSKAHMYSSHRISLRMHHVPLYFNSFIIVHLEPQPVPHFAGMMFHDAKHLKQNETEKR